MTLKNNIDILTDLTKFRITVFIAISSAVAYIAGNYLIK